ncbi:MAG: twin-arginine translocase TatA/TatE family subunit [Candidatus Eremiobacteraeota bacterium]|nr:twin-arginine translocase TatA/TatE family subunit [Candidatus Eremiobacteraeota bacterium]
MLSMTEMAVIGVAALVLFGPEQLPKMARKVGTIVRDVQNTSATFIREMERAADDYEPPHRSVHEEPPSAAAQPDSEITG